jgi:hypothetical protein
VATKLCGPAAGVVTAEGLDTLSAARSTLASLPINPVGWLLAAVGGQEQPRLLSTAVDAAGDSSAESKPVHADGEGWEATEEPWVLLGKPCKEDYLALWLPGRTTLWAPHGPAVDQPPTAAPPHASHPVATSASPPAAPPSVTPPSASPPAAPPCVAPPSALPSGAHSSTEDAATALAAALSGDTAAATAAAKSKEKKAGRAAAAAATTATAAVTVAAPSTAATSSTAPTTALTATPPSPSPTTAATASTAPAPSSYTSAPPAPAAAASIAADGIAAAAAVDGPDDPDAWHDAWDEGRRGAKAATAGGWQRMWCALLHQLAMCTRTRTRTRSRMAHACMLTLTLTLTRCVLHDSVMALFEHRRALDEASGSEALEFEGLEWSQVSGVALWPPCAFELQLRDGRTLALAADTQAAAADWVCSILRLVSRRAVLTLQQEQRGEWETIVTEAPS